MFKNKIDRPLGKLLNALGLTLISCLMILIDCVFCAFVYPGKLFVWIAFASWTVFFTSDVKDKVKAIPGYLIGAIASVGIMILSDFIFSFFKFEINGQSVTSMIASLIIIFCVMLLHEFNIFKFTSINSIFIGSWLVFSGLGVAMYPNSFVETLIIFAIIIGYSVMGLIAGYLSMLACKKTNKLYENKE